MRLESGHAHTLDRHRFFQAAPGTAAAAATGTLAWPSSSAASDDDRRNVVPPTPIPRGLEIPGLPQIHVWVPSDRSVTFPFSGLSLLGFDVEPSTFTDRRGFSALAYHVGTATGSDGQSHNLETDVRAYQGPYVDSTGQRCFGTFAFI